MTGGQWRVPLSDLLVDDEILDAVRDVVASGWWSQGGVVAEFEAEFAALCGAPAVIAVANGTAALHLALLALGCGPGDEVILPSLNFVAAANMIHAVGATPVFCDISGAHDLTLDPVDLAAAITPASKAVVVMHYGGFTCDMEAIRAVTNEHGLLVVEDAAHAPGASRGGTRSGTLGDIGCFSFFSNKNLPTGEGGMLVTAHEEHAAELRLLRSHGMTSLTWDRYRGYAESYDVVERGFNYRLDEIRAAIGRVELGRLLDANARRGRIWERYRQALDDIPGLTVPFAAHPAHHVSAHHLAPIVLPLEVDREDVRRRLREQRIETSVHYPPIHRFSAYRDSGARRQLPVTDDVADRLVTLPLFPHMDDEQVDLVTKGLRDALSAP